MSGSLSLRIAQVFNKLDNAIAFWISGGRSTPRELCLASAPRLPSMFNKGLKSFNLDELMKNGILWAVPKRRRTIEKRMNRKFGWPELFWKPLVPRTNLLMCTSCGHTHEAGYLCSHCYKKVQDETKLMQDAVQDNLGLNPVEKEVVILYKGERQSQPAEFWEGKRIVELDKERPQWFSRNLLEKTTQAPSTSKDIKPTELA